MILYSFILFATIQVKDAFGIRAIHLRPEETELFTQGPVNPCHCHALGNLTGFHLTPGQTFDLEGADALLPGTPAATVIADKAYDAQERIIEPLQKAGKGVVIPPKRCHKQPHEYDRYLYRARHLIGQFFNKLKQYGSIATRYGLTISTNLRGYGAICRPRFLRHRYYDWDRG